MSSDKVPTLEEIGRDLNKMNIRYTEIKISRCRPVAYATASALTGAATIALGLTGHYWEAAVSGSVSIATGLKSVRDSVNEIYYRRILREYQNEYPPTIDDITEDLKKLLEKDKSAQK